MKKAIVQVSVSGGRTSAYMAVWMQNNRDKVAAHIGVDEVTYLYCFANTGMEHDDTLRFMNDVNRFHLDSQAVWVEADIFHGKRKSSGHKIVGFETAHRNNQWDLDTHPFHNYIKKYGIPNVKFPSCTRELKLNPIKSYMRSLGLSPKDYYTAIGIRADESRRVSASADVQNIIYPLVDLAPTDKEDVLDFWADYDYDLNIPEWLGNCVTCYKKSYKKLLAVYRETPEHYGFNAFMEANYCMVGPEFKKHGATRPRTFFRLDTSTEKLISIFNINDLDPRDIQGLIQDGGCSESCEMYPTE